ncbi:MAG: alpha/beta hydrolase, partial [Bacteroidia bacterium]|nr:alpha/beta hydrolase [Bacteroidia bacterium]
RLTNIIVAGHSEGSLIGMLAANSNKKVKAFISIAGAGRPADVIIKEQFSKVPDNIKMIVFPMLDKVKKGDSIPNVPTIFYPYLRPSIQPYMHSWFKYDPAEEIKKLKIPVLILQGNMDMQVKETDAELLHKALPKSELKIIPDMNHVLKDCNTLDKEIQKPIYTNPDLPLNTAFVKELMTFISKQ